MGATLGIRGTDTEWIVVREEEATQTEIHFLVLRQKLAAFVICLLPATPRICCRAAAMLCLAPYPRLTCGPALATVADAANASQLPLPPKPGRLVSLVVWVRQAVDNLRQPWDPRRAKMVAGCISVRTAYERPP